ncbi:MAG TPA: hypothetical protein VGH27_17745 [Streptosporangiaceae bacterium]|jgi:hypothetical protein
MISWAPVAGVAVLACAVAGCSGFSPPPHAAVSAAQRAAISRYYLSELWPGQGLGPGDGYPRVACPVDVLGAARTGRRLRVYTVVHCTSANQACAGGTEYTDGLVADLTGTTITGVQRDDAPYYSGMIAESKIYPPALRSAALNDINYAGPAWLATLAATTEGCPHGVH